MVIISWRIIYIHYCFSVMFNKKETFISKRWQDTLQKGIDSSPHQADYIQHFFRFVLFYPSIDVDIVLSVISNINFHETVRLMFITHCAIVRWHDTQHCNTQLWKWNS